MEAKDVRGPIEAQLRAWGAELDKLKAKVDKEIAEAKKEYYERIEGLRDDIEAQVKKWGREVEAAKEKVGVAELRAKIEAELAQWGPEIEALRAKAGRAAVEATRLIEELKARRKALEAKLAELKRASGGAWEDVKTGMTKAWEELRPALQNAIAKFK